MQLLEPIQRVRCQDAVDRRATCWYVKFAGISRWSDADGHLGMRAQEILKPLLLRRTKNAELVRRRGQRKTAGQYTH